MGVPITLPTVGGSSNTWGTTLNAALNQLNGYDVFAAKSADQSSPASTTTLFDDAHMALALPAAGTYVVEGMFLMSSASTTPEIKVAWAYTGTLTNGYRASVGPSTASTDPSGATAQGVRVAASGISSALINNAVAYGLDGTNWSAAFEHGLVVVSTSGTLKVQWAQNVANATVTTMRAGSFFWARRVA